MLKKYLKIKKFGAYLMTAILVIGFSFSLQAILAYWTAPTANPLDDNTVLPLFNDSTNSNPANNPAIFHSLGVTGNLSLLGASQVSMTGGRITGVGAPINPDDAVNRGWMINRIQNGAGCTSYTVRQGVSEAYCNTGEKFIIGGCTFSFADQDDFPIVNGFPVVSSGRPGWFCNYKTRRYITSPTLFYGPYAGSAWVLCCL